MNSDFSRTSKNDSLISLKLHGKNIYFFLKKYLINNYEYIIIDTFLSKRIFPNKNAKKTLIRATFQYHSRHCIFRCKICQNHTRTSKIAVHMNRPLYFYGFTSRKLLFLVTTLLPLISTTYLI